MPKVLLIGDFLYLASLTYNLEVANLPAVVDTESLPEATERLHETIAEQVSAGRRPDEIARRIYPHDLRKRRQLRLKIWHLVRYDDRFATRLAARARGEMLLSLVPATRALGVRAGRGRTDAAKLLYEASGFHNPRVQHQHSGEIKIKLDMPRPSFNDPTDPIVDADVVD